MTTRATSTWAVPVIALIAVAASGAWLVTQEGPRLDGWDGDGSTMGDGTTMGDGYGSGPVDGLAGARGKVEEFADAIGLLSSVGAHLRTQTEGWAAGLAGSCRHAPARQVKPS